MAERDGHYELLYVIAVLAGASHEEAHLVAYASQFTDDAELHKGFVLHDLDSRFLSLVKDGLFEPICTAYGGIKMWYLLLRGPQKKTLVPFHFVPPKFYLGGAKYDFRVQYKSFFILAIVEEAVLSLRSAQTENERTYALIKLGIALHSFLDTATHSGFAGIWSPFYNDISDLCEDGRTRDLALNIAPDVGHAEAREFPDLPYLSFWYKTATGKVIGRNNTAVFLKAAQDMFDILADVFGIGGRKILEEEWRRIQYCLSFRDKSLDARVENWHRIFPEMNFHYDKNEWEREAIGPVSADSKTFTTLGDLKWFWFHLSAKEQREFVLARIKTDLKFSWKEFFGSFGWKRSESSC